MHHASRSAPWKKRNSARLPDVVAADVVGEVGRLVGRHHRRGQVEEDDRQRLRENDAQRRGARERVVDGSAGRARLAFQQPCASATGSFSRTLNPPDDRLASMRKQDRYRYRCEQTARGAVLHM